MLSDFIPIYWPKSNTWSIPACEVEEYEDRVAKPQNLVLYEGHVVKGIPLMHLSVWGYFNVDVTSTVRNIAKNPKRACARMFPEDAAEMAAFYGELKRRYPKIVSVRQFRKGRTPASRYLDVPMAAIVKFTAEDA